MATLEDKILGEKTHYYCSSSEDEDDGEEKGSNGTNQPNNRPSTNRHQWEGMSTNTGPKGVIEDWRRFKQLENEKKEESEREKLELMKKLSMSCNPDKPEEEVDKEVQELLEGSDAVMEEFMQKRMLEMMQKKDQQTRSNPQFGQLHNLDNGQEFLDAIDRENKNVTVIVHIYTDDIPGCEAMNGCLRCLAADYPYVKFCCMEANKAGMSHRFEKSGVPALLVYKAGVLLGNFVRLSDEFGEDFYANDVEAFLIEHGLLPDKAVPELVKSESRIIMDGNAQDESDSDD